MATTTTATETTTLTATLANRYGVTVLTAPAEAIEWAAEHIADTIGASAAAAAWRKANARRARAGLYTSIPAYGSKLWGAF
jgi:hypothetical protein